MTHPVALAHDPGRGHPERSERLQAILDHLRDCGLASQLDWVEPDIADIGLVALAHERSYLDLLVRLDEAGGARLDPDTAMSERTLEASLRGSQAAVQAAANVLQGRWTAGFVLTRPPGHHATQDRAMGFCFTNHAAVAARWAVREGRAKRVLVLDWDAHHGNGTQDIFWTDPQVLYASLHQYGTDPLASGYAFYPGTGGLAEIGEGLGRGTTVNVPLPAGAGEDAYTAALQEVVLPAARRFEPDLTVVSAGYDAHVADPLCSMRLRAGAFYRFTRMLSDLGTGMVFVLEGGYDLDALAWSTAATVSALLGDDPPHGVPGNELERIDGDPQAIDAVQRAAVVHVGGAST